MRKHCINLNTITDCLIWHWADNPKNWFLLFLHTTVQSKRESSSIVADLSTHYERIPNDRFVIEIREWSMCHFFFSPCTMKNYQVLIHQHVHGAYCLFSWFIRDGVVVLAEKKYSYIHSESDMAFVEVSSRD